MVAGDVVGGIAAGAWTADSTGPCVLSTPPPVTYRSHAPCPGGGKPVKWSKLKMLGKCPSHHACRSYLRRYIARFSGLTVLDKATSSGSDVHDEIGCSVGNPRKRLWTGRSLGYFSLAEIWTSTQIFRDEADGPKEQGLTGPHQFFNCLNHTGFGSRQYRPSLARS